MGTVHYTYEDVISYAVLIEQKGIKLYTDAEGLNSRRNILLICRTRKHEEYF